MAPSVDFSRLWGKDSSRKGTPVVVTMENPNYSVLQIDGPDAAFRPVDKDRGKNAKQFTWVLLLKAHRAVGCLSWLGNALWILLGAIKKRLIFGQGVTMENEKSGRGRLLFRTILAFLLMSLAFLAFEVFAHFNGWHYFHNHGLHIPQTLEIKGWLHAIYVAWLEFRADYIAPSIQVLSSFCVALFLIQSADRMLLCLGCFWIKYKKIKPRIEGDPFKSDDLEGLGYDYPMVLVQIPMCNEREVRISMLLDSSEFLIIYLCTYSFSIRSISLSTLFKSEVPLLCSSGNHNSRIWYEVNRHCYSGFFTIFIVIDDFESIPFRFMNNRYQQCANLIGQKTDY